MKYQVIVADPPWPFPKGRMLWGGRKKLLLNVPIGYDLMSLEQIKGLPVGKLATKNGWLFLWTTQKMLFDAKSVMESWGFRYLFTMVWKKVYPISSGMPLAGFRWNAEFVLVGTMGKLCTFKKGPLIPMVFEGKNLGHSQKPDEFYELVEKLSRPEKRIDLFARKEREGWVVWGNQVNGVDLPGFGG